MRNSKKRLIHCAFQTAKVLGLKLQMNETDYNAFYKSCKIDDNYNGADYTKELVVHDHSEACRLKALHIDYNPIYGGYRLDQYCNDSGGMSFFLDSTRRNAETLSDLLNTFCLGFCRAMELKEAYESSTVSP